LVCVAGHAEVLEVGQGRLYVGIKDALAAAEAYDTIMIYPGTYREGSIDINKPMVINGIDSPVLDGENEYEIIRVRVDSVVIRGLTLRDVGVSYVEDRSAIRLISSKHCIIESNQLVNSFFGIYLEHCQYCIIRNNRVIGIAEHEMNTGNAIHLWYCKNIRILGNHAEGHRDGIYLEFVDNSTVENNMVVNNIRYGLHFMFSDHDRYLANHFESNGAGVAVMFSKFIRMEDNDFIDNWGSSAYGLLLKDITDSEIRFNRFRGNTTGIYGEGVSRTLILNNDFARNGWALKILGSCADNTIRRNNFMNNTFDVSTNTSRNYNDYDGNFWSDNTTGYDLDRDGVSDIPYRPVKLFSYMVGNMQSTTILMRSLLVDLINHAEKVAPVITPHNLLDHEPLMIKIDHDRDFGTE
jgi:nitrous oxidase accessory protein